MRRLHSTIICDIRLQVRQGFYYAAAFVALFWAIVLSRAPSDRLLIWMPVFILSNILINTFYFMAGLVFLEKAEGTLMAQCVTPLRNWEYLLSKLVTLALVAVGESLVIIVAGYRGSFTPLGFISGIVFSAVICSLAGFLFVIRYDSINEFLFPSFLFTLISVPPFLGYFDLLGTPLLYLHPLQGPVLLTKAAFGPIAGWQWVYSVLSSALWFTSLLALSNRAFKRFVIATEGSES
jgi:fluoroquinolone transport system permease protein